MADLTTNNLVNLDQLDQRNAPTDISKMLVRTNGTDEFVLYKDVYDTTIDKAKTDQYNFGWNASKIDDVPISSEGYADGKILIYGTQEGSFYPKSLMPNDIDWSQFDDNDFVKVNANGDLIPSNISVTDLIPTSSANADKFLQVSSDGTQIIESDFDFDSLLNYPDVAETNANRIDSGLFVAGYSTVNKPATGEQGYIISSRLRTDPSQQNPRAAQIFISTDSDDIKVRKNSGSLGIDDFGDWYTLYTNINHPISSDISSTSTTNIANSNAVKSVNDRVTALDNSYNANNVLGKLITVDGSGSGIDADKLDGYEFTDLEARFVNVTGDTITGTITINNGNKTRYTKGTSFLDIRSDDSRAVLDANNSFALLNGSSAQRLYSGGILVSNNYNQATLIPTDGIYSKGLVKSGTGYDVGNTEVIDSSGNLSWNRLKDVPSDINNLGSASQRDVGTASDQVPLNSTIQNALLPTGAVLPFAGDTGPNGWLVCDGSAVSRSTYSALYAYIGTKYGSGNGSTTFNLPDMRNQFVRGASDTRPVGNEESDLLGSHNHTGSTGSAGNHNHIGSTSSAGEHYHGSGHYVYANFTRYGNTGSSGTRPDGGVAGGREPLTSTVGDHSHSLTINSNGTHSHAVGIGYSGGSETRPQNIALLYCIKY